MADTINSQFSSCIGVVGLGFVGLTLAIAAADSGYTVYGTEVNPKILALLKENHAHFHETGLDALIQKHNGKNFFSSEKFPSDEKFDAFIITVGTPLLTGTYEPNFGYIRQAVQSIREVYDGSQLVILRSTVSVSTTRNVIIPFLQSMCGKPDVLVSMCPERTVEGRAIEELTHLPQIISGNNEKALAFAEKIFTRITTSVLRAKSLEEAELAKLFCNTYRDIYFAVGNAFCLSAQTFGIDGIDVIRLANEGYSRADIAVPGFVAGPCLEKDAYILAHNMKECPAKDFILSGRKINSSLEDAVCDWVRNNVKGKTIALSGMAFKGRPETSDLRGSPSVNIARKLYAMGCELRLHDFAAYIDEMDALGLGRAFETIHETCEGADALLILNNHEKYLGLTREDLGNENITVLDSWQVCKKIKGTHTLGNMLLNTKEAC
ncbi:MAG: nucleotide sugar dehydrogenase [Synergistaceae bacterium]|nr:nucleotide sugar dehydrogenase [Synergistaceae bacterium]